MFLYYPCLRVFLDAHSSYTAWCLLASTLIGCDPAQVLRSGMQPGAMHAVIQGLSCAWRCWLWLLSLPQRLKMLPLLRSSFKAVFESGSPQKRDSKQAIVARPWARRHRLVVPKYNPARTVTPEGAVGLGGAYMCIYPMDSPGGYQLIGRTLPIWNTFGRVGPFSPAKPWLLRNFDQVRMGPACLHALRQHVHHRHACSMRC